MKLANQSIKYLSVSFLFIISLWAVVFYFSILDEIKESVDEELENYKRQIVSRSESDTTILGKNNFDKDFFTIREIGKPEALAAKDRYVDTVVNMQDADDEEPELEPVRMLSTAFEFNGHYYKLVIINSMVEEDDLIAELLWDTVWLYLILIIGIIVINNFGLQRLWNPFYNLLDQLKNYKLGRNKELVEIKTKTKEFADLQNAVNILLKHSAETYEQQKQFIGNASHELQTPLAVVTNKLELLIENGGLNDAQAARIAGIMNIVERLVRLNKSLLLLTRIENKQFLDNQVVSINSIVRQNIHDLEETAAYKNVNITLAESAELTVQMDISLANILIANLLRNAIFHNIANGMVTIDISENAISLTNTGVGISLAAEKIFDRFYKSDTAEAGIGLGLPIVKAICNIYGFTINYRFVNNRHSFDLRFKK